MEGIDALFGRNTSTVLVVKTVLLHVSIRVIEQWPQAAPLKNKEIHQYLDDELLPLLKVVMLVDNELWEFFDPKTKEQYRNETLVVFAEVERQLGSPGTALPLR